jgi:signal transduction histidine kinase
MMERMDAIGGMFNISSSPAGTVVLAAVSHPGK